MTSDHFLFSLWSKFWVAWQGRVWPQRNSVWGSSRQGQSCPLRLLPLSCSGPSEAWRNTGCSVGSQGPSQGYFSAEWIVVSGFSNWAHKIFSCHPYVIFPTSMPGIEEFPYNLSVLFLKVEKHLRIVHGMPCVIRGAWKKFNIEGAFLRLKCKTTV